MSVAVIKNAKDWVGASTTIEKIVQANKSNGFVIPALKDGKPIFLLSSHPNWGMLGTIFPYRLVSQREASGRLEIQNYITISATGVSNYLTEIGLTDKRPLYVFK